MRRREILKKASTIAANVLLYTFLAICIFGVVLSLGSKRGSDDATTLFGVQMRTVVSPSMEKCAETDVSQYKIKDIPLKSMIFIEVVPKDAAEAENWYASLKVGDVLTFKYVYVRQETITHRITQIEPNGRGGYTIRLEGDNKSSGGENLVQTIDTSEKNTPNYVIGKVTGKSYLLGLLISALKSPLGLVFIIIIPAFLVVILEVLRIVKLFTADKRKKDQEEKDQQQRELDELRRRLAQLEGLTPTASPPPAQAPPTQELSTPPAQETATPPTPGDVPKENGTNGDTP